MRIKPYNYYYNYRQTLPYLPWALNLTHPLAGGHDRARKTEGEAPNGAQVLAPPVRLLRWLAADNMK